MKLITSAAAIALGLSFVTPSTAQIRDDIQKFVGTCNEHGWVKTWGNGTYLAIGESGDFIEKSDGKETKGRWSYLPRHEGAVSIPIPSSSDPTLLRPVCPNNKYRF